MTVQVLPLSIVVTRDPNYMSTRVDDVRNSINTLECSRSIYTVLAGHGRVVDESHLCINLDEHRQQKITVVSDLAAQLLANRLVKLNP